MSNKVRFILFSTLTSALCAVYAVPIVRTFAQSFESMVHSHLVLMPFIAAYFVFIERKKFTLEKVRPAWIVGAALIAGGAALGAVGMNKADMLSDNDFLAALIGSLELVFFGIASILFGIRVFTAFPFAVLMLLFAIPIPDMALDGFVHALRVGSNHVVNVIFKLLRVTYHREGFIYHLPQLSFNIAPQCSGIRSSIAVIITSLMAGKLMLKTMRNRILLIAAALPITMFKNAIRISVLTLMGSYIDERILASDLHRRGGLPFFILALLLLGAVLFALMKTEAGKQRKQKTESDSGESGPA
ncbi:MAG: hypothetical protein GF398_21975 [Chitinivibrionales bacterium]|nr:hypothetical protein [Chitinivibrionales bacterium]